MFSIDTTFFTVAGYPLSYVEFIGTLTGLIAVWLASRNHILSWPIGLVNVVCFFLIFYQVQLYSDMFLQAYFFATGIYGWWYWTRYDPRHQAVTALSAPVRWKYAVGIAVSTVVLGYAIARIHLVWPQAFSRPAAYPYVDTFIAVASVVANLLLARRIWENWVLWIAVDAIATFVYFDKGIKFVSVEYFVFLLIAISGLTTWLKLYRRRPDPGSAENAIL